ncbi:MAG: RsmD family RNA methyltransferase [Opitutales bacterium]
MRITGGAARGIRLTAPRGLATRPATDALREALFSRLGPAIVGARAIDLFAGTGAYGLEALSRGAAQVTFVESAKLALSALRANLAAVERACGGSLEATVQAADVFRWPSPEALPDILIADPPYELLRLKADALAAKLEHLSGDDTVIALEAPGNIAAPAGFTCERRLGKTGDGPSLLLLRRIRG